MPSKDKQLIAVLDRPFFWKALHMYHSIFAVGIIGKVWNLMHVDYFLQAYN